MNLIRFTLEGFRRFRNKTEIDLRDKTIAIVGPNETGKTTLVARALPRLTNPLPFARQGSIQDITRGLTPKADAVTLSAHYQLSTDDQDAVRHVGSTTTPQLLLAYQRASDGEMQYTLEPRPQRDTAPRKRLAKRIGTLLKDQLSVIQSIKGRDYTQLLPEVGQILTSDDQNLSQKALERLSGCVAAIQADASDPAHEPLREIGAELAELSEQESRNLKDGIIGILKARMPRVLTVQPDELNLLAEYPVEGIAANTPPAFKNLARLANLNLRDLSNAHGTGDQGMMETIIIGANTVLDKKIKEAWRQTPTTVRLRVDAGVIRVLASTEGVPFDSIAERSDGLRRFIALMGFLDQEASPAPPILLIDEIETHLHYDAQADLITMLTKQTAAGKIIYTTHSAGSLPEDLTGVRSIEYDEKSRSSVIKNWFWTDKRPGIGPLLFSMGAATLAFFSTRYAVICEGPTDFLLLPTMFREATGNDHLGFQVVPGIAGTGAANIGILDREAPRTLYVLDADASGRAIEAKLLSAGVPPDRIHHIPDPGKKGLVLEDLIDKDAYHQAVNAGLQEINGTTATIPLSAIPDVNRPGMLEKWCKQNQVNMPSKTLIARLLLEKRGGQPMVGPSHRPGLRDLYEEVHEIFKSA